MNELERQDVLRGKFMATLLAKGILRQELSVENFTDRLDEFDEMFVDMIAWLHSEGYIRCSGLFQGSDDETIVSEAVPTARGIALLDQKIEGETTGRDLVDASLKGDHASWGKLGAFVGGLLGGFVQSAQ